MLLRVVPKSICLWCILTTPDAKPRFNFLNPDVRFPNFRLCYHSIEVASLIDEPDLDKSKFLVLTGFLFTKSWNTKYPAGQSSSTYQKTLLKDRSFSFPALALQPQNFLFLSSMCCAPYKTEMTSCNMPWAPRENFLSLFILRAIPENETILSARI